MAKNKKTLTAPPSLALTADVPPILEGQEYKLEPIDSLEDHPANPNEGDLGGIHESIAENGFFGAVIAQRSTRRILAGMHRRKAYKAHGAAEIPVIWVDCDDDRALKILLADNRLARLGMDNQARLAELLTQLQKGPGLSGTGYDVDDLNRLLAELKKKPTPGADDTPSVPRVAFSRTGDVWTLGNHRLVCGDARDPACWEQLIEPGGAQLLWTDPPYGVEYEGKTKDALTIENDARSIEALRDLLRRSFDNAAMACEAGAPWYVAAPHGPNFYAFAATLYDMGIWRETLVWVKDTFVLGHSDYHYRHEAIFYGWTPGAAHYFIGARNLDTAWEIASLPNEHGRLVEIQAAEGTDDGSLIVLPAGSVTPDAKRRRLALLIEFPKGLEPGLQDDLLLYDKPSRSEHHPTTKPVALVQRALENSSRPGQTVVDPFAGSSTTIIACEGSARKARAMEVDPCYVDVGVVRWTELTGKVATCVRADGTHAICAGGLFSIDEAA